MVTMLEKAINYVQCLELQIRVRFSQEELSNKHSRVGTMFKSQKPDQH
jgi:hypothetical protein